MAICFCKHGGASVAKGASGAFHFFRNECAFQVCQYCGGWCDPGTGFVVYPGNERWLQDELPWADRHHLTEFVRTLLGILGLRQGEADGDASDAVPPNE